MALKCNHLMFSFSDAKFHSDQLFVVVCQSGVTIHMIGCSTEHNKQPYIAI